jgi:hypothetical protein
MNIEDYTQEELDDLKAQTDSIVANLKFDYERLKHDMKIDHLIPELERDAEPKRIKDKSP